MTQLLRVAVQQRDELITAHKGIQLLRRALEARQAATHYARPTLAEIRLRAFDQARAARGMSCGFERVGNWTKTREWRDIANDFERAAQILAPAA